MDKAVRPVEESEDDAMEGQRSHHDQGASPAVILDEEADDGA